MFQQNSLQQLAFIPYLGIKRKERKKKIPNRNTQDKIWLRKHYFGNFSYGIKANYEDI